MSKQQRLAHDTWLDEELTKHWPTTEETEASIRSRLDALKGKTFDALAHVLLDRHSCFSPCVPPDLFLVLDKTVFFSLFFSPFLASYQQQGWRQ